jgi:hypothetical protein
MRAELGVLDFSIDRSVPSGEGLSLWRRDYESGFADLGFHLAIVESRGEFFGIHRVFCGAEDLSVFIHGDGVAASQGGGGVQGAEDGCVSGESRFFVLQLGVGAALEGVAVGGESAGKVGDFQIWTMACKDSGLALKEQPKLVWSGFCEGLEVFEKAVECLLLFLENSARFKEKRGSLQGDELIAQSIEAHENWSSKAGGEVLEFVEQFARIGGEDFSGGAGSRGSEVGGEIANGKIDFVSHGTHDGDRAGCNGSGDGFLIEFPEVFQAAAATSHHNHIEGGQAGGRRIAKQADGFGDLGSGTFSLNSHGTDDDFDASLTAVKDIQEILNGCACGRSHHADAAWELRQWAFFRGVEQAFGIKSALEFLKLGLQCADSAFLDAADDDLVVSAWFVNGEGTLKLNLHAVGEVHASQLGGLASEEHAGDLGA